MGKRFTLNVVGTEVSLAVDASSPRLFKRLAKGMPHEVGVAGAFMSAARQSTCFLDVGSHVGWYGALAAAANQRLAIVLVEPNGACLKIAVANTRLNGVRNVVAIPAAAGQWTGVTFLNEDSSADSMLSHAAPEAKGQCKVVTQRTIDSICEELGVYPDLLKIDVEGAELEVLLGSARLLATSPTVFLELHGHLQDGREVASEVIQLLTDRRYELSMCRKDAAGRSQHIGDQCGNVMLIANPRRRRSWKLNRT